MNNYHSWRLQLRVQPPDRTRTQSDSLQRICSRARSIIYPQSQPTDSRQIPAEHKLEAFSTCDGVALRSSHHRLASLPFVARFFPISSLSPKVNPLVESQPESTLVCSPQSFPCEHRSVPTPSIPKHCPAFLRQAAPRVAMRHPYPGELGR